MPDSAQDKTLVLTVTKAAKLVGVSASTLRRYEAQGKITSKRLDNGYRKFVREDVLNLRRKIDEEKRLAKEPEKVIDVEIISQSHTSNHRNIVRTAQKQQIQQKQVTKNYENDSKSILYQNLTLKHGLNKRVNSLLAGISIISSIAVLGLAFLMAPQATRNQITESGKEVLAVVTARITPNRAQYRSSIADSKDAESDIKQFFGMVLGKRVTKPDFELEISVPTTIKSNLSVEGGITADTLSVLGGGLNTKNQDIDAGTGNITAGNLTLTTPGGLNNLLIIDDTTKETLQESLEIAGDVEGTDLTDVEVVKLGGADVGDISDGTLLILDGDEIIGGDLTDLDTTEIVELGVITTGTWHATPVETAYGGTNLTTYTTGDMVYASASNTLKQLNIGTEGYIMTSTGGIPAWSEVNSALGGNVFLNLGNSFGTTATLGTNDAYALALETNNTTHIFINSTGSIGIGNETPGTKVHLGDRSRGPSYVADESESMYIEGNLEVTGTIYGGAVIGPTGYDEGSVTFIGSTGYLDQNNDQFFWNDTTERLGIGTSSPAYKLDVIGTVGIDGDMTFIGDQSIAGTGTLTINPTGNLYFQSSSYYIDETGILTIAKAIATEVEYSGNITLDANSSVGTTTVTVTNEDGTQIANLEVEGDVNITGGKLTLASGETIDAETSNTLAFQSDGDIKVVLGDNAGTNEFAIYDSTGVTKVAYINSDGQATLANSLTVQAGGASITGNITVTGTVDGRDIATDGSNLDNLYTTIGLSALTSTEVDQLENIGTTTVSATQWTYLGALDQGLTTTSAPTFTTINTGQGAYELFAMNQDVETSDTVDFAGLSIGGTTPAMTAILDEDNMASDSATALATQQSIKSYTDTQVATADQLAELTDTSLSTLADADLLIYDTATSTWYNKPLSGDATITDAGALSLADNTVDDAELVNSLTYTGTLNLTGTWQIGSTTVSSTAAELNILDDATLTTAELNILAGATLTTAELNLLDGTTATAGGIMFGNGTYLTQDNANFYWDDSAKRLGIGTTAPSYTLDINGDAKIANGSDLYTYSGASYSMTLGNRTYTEQNFVTSAQTFTASVDALDQQLQDLTSGSAGLWQDSGSITYLDSTTDNLAVGGTAATAKLYFETASSALILNPYGSSTGNTAEFRLTELTANGTEYTGFKAPDSLDSSIMYTLPNASGSADYVLTYQTGGSLEWKDVTGVGGAGDITQVGSIISGAAFSDNNSDDNWLGLGASAGRIEFDDQAIDEVNILNANVGIGTSTPSYTLDVAGNINLTGNITVTGTVDGRDIATDGSNLDNLYTTIGLSALTSTEVDQLENVGATTVSSTQWSYLGDLNQGLTTTSAPTFATINTGQGAYELFAMNQDVQTSSAVQFASISIGGTAPTMTAILDEDNMASNSATALATQQSIKAYTDTQVATEDELNELDDVNVSTRTDADLLIYDSDTSTWYDRALSGDATITDLGVISLADNTVDDAELVNSLTYTGTLDLTGTWQIDSTTVSSTAAELNYLDGTTVTDGGIMFGNGTYVAQDNANLYWNNTDDRLGIGTTAPSYTLDVVGDIQIVNGSDLYSFGSVTLGSRTYTTPQYVADNQTFTASVQALDDQVYALSQGSAGLWLDQTSYIQAANYTDFVIEDAGNVGIGTTDPSEKLDVQGNIYLTGTLSNGITSLSTSNFTSTEGLDFDLGDNTGTYAFDIRDSDDSNLFSIDSDGNLSLSGESASYVLNNGSSTAFMITNSGTGDSFRVNDVSSDTTPFVIDGGGNVGIGTTAPGAKLDVDGTGAGVIARIQRDSGTLGRLDISFVAGFPTIDSINNDMIFKASGTEIMRLDNFSQGVAIGGYTGNLSAGTKLAVNGNVGIGTTAPSALLSVGATSQFTVNSSGAITAATGVTSSGDITLSGVAGGTDNTVVVIDGSGKLFYDEVDSRIWGSSLTDFTGTPLNNQLAVWTDTDTLEGDSNFTWDGTNFDIGADDKLLRFGTSQDYSIQWDGDDAVHTISAGDFVFAGGNVGIGTTSPGTELEIYRGGAGDDVTLKINAQGSGGVDSKLTLEASLNEAFINYNSWSALLTIQNSYVAGETGIAFNPKGSTEVMRIQSGGVGIGDASPDALLEVSASGGASDLLKLSSDDGNDGDLFVVKNSGNVGIGTTNPSSFKLQVAGNVGPQVDSTYDLGSDSIRWSNLYADNIYGSFTPTGFDQGPVVFGGSGGALDQDNGLWWDDSNKRLGIGTTAPALKLDVNGRIRTLADNSAIPTSGEGIEIFMTNTNIANILAYDRDNSAYRDLYVNNATGNALVVKGSGNIGIGTTAPGAKLEVAGTAKINDSLTIGTGDSGDTLNLVNNVGTYTLSGYTLQAPDSFLVSAAAGGYLRLTSGTHADGITFYANGSEKMRVNSAGNVGIGTTAPNGKLQINTASGGTITDPSATTNIFGSVDISSREAPLAIYDNDGTYDTLGIGGGILFGGQYNDSGDYQLGAGLKAVRENTSSNNDKWGLALYTSRDNDLLNEVVRIDWSGNLGVGVLTNLQSKLTSVKTQSTVVSNTNVMADFALALRNNNVTSNTFAGIAFDVTTETEDIDAIGAAIYAQRDASAGATASKRDTNLMFATNDDADDDLTVRMTITHDGNVGIGTTAPDKIFHVSHSTANTLGKFESLDTISRLEIADSDDIAYVGTQSNKAFFGMSGDLNPINLIVDSSGNVGIGTTSPSSLLSVGATSQFQVDSSGEVVNIGGIAHSIVDTSGDLVITGAGDLAFDDDTLSSAVDLSVADTGLNGSLTQGIVDAINDIYDLSIGGAGALRLDGGDYAYLNTSLASNIQVAEDSWLGIGSGSERVVFDGSGGDISFMGANVGIGTTAPGGELHIFRSDVTETAWSSSQLVIESASDAYMEFLADAGETGGHGFMWSDGATGVGRLVYIHSDDSLRFWTAGGEKVRIDNNGNVGIGTTAPEAKFHVASANVASTSETGFLQLYTTNYGEDYGPSIVFGGKHRSDLVGEAGWAGIAGRKTGGDAYAKGYLQFLTRASAGGIQERVRIDENGNVGIGTTGPSARLHVRDNGISQTTLLAQQDDDNNWGLVIGNAAYDTLEYRGLRMKSIGDDYGLIEVYQSGAYRDLALNPNGGNVGIGTTAPEYTLEVATGDNATARFYNQTPGESTSVIIRDGATQGNDYALNIQNNAGTSSLAGWRTVSNTFGAQNFNLPYAGMVKWSEDTSWENATSNLAIARNSSGVLEINNGTAGQYRDLQLRSINPTSGNVGIGTTAPSEKLEIRDGNIKLTRSESPGVYFVTADLNYSGADTFNLTSTYGSFFQYDLTGRKITLNDSGGTGSTIINGNVGIGTTGPSQKLDIVGAVRFGSALYGILNQNSGGWPDLGSNYYNDAGTQKYYVTNAAPAAASKILFDGYSGMTFSMAGSGTAGNAITWSEKVRIDTSGNVGIGTTSPSGRLQVVGDEVRIGNAGTINYATGDGDLYVEDVLEVDGTIYGDLVGGITPTGFDQGPVVFGGSGGVLDQDDDLWWDDTNKRLGIGTTGPSSLLELYGASPKLKLTDSGALDWSIRADTNNFYIRDESNNADVVSLFAGGSVVFNDDSNDANFRIEGDTNANVFVVDGGENAVGIGGYSTADLAGTTGKLLVNGNVGIGTTTPLSRLQVDYSAEDETGGLILRNTSGHSNADAFMSIQHNAGDGGWSLGIDSSNDYLSFAYSPTSIATNVRMVIDKEGNVGIGTDSPLSKLGVLGNLAVGGTYGAFAAPSDGLIVEGNVGIGTTAPTKTLHVVGAAYNMTAQFLSSGNTELRVGSTATNNPYIDMIIDNTAGTPYGRIRVGDGLNWRNLVLQSDGGNVGIGTTAPGAKLDVSHLASAYSNIDGIRLTNTGTSAGSGTSLSFYSRTTSNKLSRIRSLDVGTNAGTLFLETGNGSDFSPVMTLTNGGNVGIGTTAPGAKLDISSTGLPLRATRDYASSNTKVGVTTFARTNSGGAGADGIGGYLYFGAETETEGTLANVARLGWSLDDATAGTEDGILTFGTAKAGNIVNEVMRITNGNVGIGTTAPTSALSFPSASHIGIATADASDDGYLTIGGGGVHGASRGAGLVLAGNENSGGQGVVRILAGDDSAKGYIMFETNNDEVAKFHYSGGFSFGDTYIATDPGVDNMIIEGNVGIGTTAPENILHVFGGESSGAAVNAGSDNLVLENDDTFYVNILTPNDKAGGILFSDDTRAMGAIIYDHAAGYGPANSMNFIAGGGNAKVSILDTGNVGIGTTAPGAKLDVSHLASAYSNIDGIRLTNTGTSAGSGTSLSFYSRTTSNKLSRIRSLDVGTNAGTLFLETGNGSDFSPVMTLTNGGNVGIGTTAPTAKLDVLAAANKSFRVLIPSGHTSPTDFSTGGVMLGLSRPLDGSVIHGIYTYDTAGATKMNLAISARSDLVFQTGDGYTAAPERMRIDQSGNVGIGTTAPGGRFEVNDGTNTDFIIETGGEVGIGLASPNAKLEVRGDIVVRSAAESAGVIRGDNTGWGTSGAIQINASNTAADRYVAFGSTPSGSSGEATFTERMRILAAGNVGIGTTAPGAKLDVAGDVTLSAATGGGARTLTVRNSAGAGSINETAELVFGHVTSGLGGKIISRRIGDYTSGSANKASALDFYTTSGAVDVLQMTILDSGNVGIGTAGPGNKLEIEQGASATAAMKIDLTGSGLGSWPFLRGDGRNYDFNIEEESASADARSGISLQSSLSMNFMADYGNSGDGIFRFLFNTQDAFDNTKEVMRIQENGYVGIGTTLPSAALDVIGNAEISGSLTLGLTTTNTDLASFFAGYSSVELNSPSPSTLEVSPGSVLINGKWRRNTSKTTINLWEATYATGESAKTTCTSEGETCAGANWFVYAVADTDATTFTIVLSEKHDDWATGGYYDSSGSAPTGLTNYKLLGYFQQRPHLRHDSTTSAATDNGTNEVKLAGHDWTYVYLGENTLTTNNNVIQPRWVKFTDDNGSFVREIERVNFDATDTILQYGGADIAFSGTVTMVYSYGIIPNSVVTNDNLDGTTLKAGVPLPGMVKVGSIAVDIYEATAWNASDDTIDEDLNDLTTNVLASKFGQKVGRNATQYDARRVALRTGKRLLTSAEWLKAISGTPDTESANPGEEAIGEAEDYDDTDGYFGQGKYINQIWHTSSGDGGISNDGDANHPYGSTFDTDADWGLDYSKILAGTAVNAFSQHNVYDGVGNVWEWNEDTREMGEAYTGAAGWRDVDSTWFNWDGSINTLPLTGNTEGNDNERFNYDGVYIYTDGSNTKTYCGGYTCETAALLRGGIWYYGARAGVFSLRLNISPSYTYYHFGLRGAR